MRGAVAALGLVLAGWPLASVAQTTITADVGARGLGTTVSPAGRTFTIDGGTRAGGNLFHSFGQFSLGAGDTAAWTRSAGDAGAITNVINRVTGGQVSQIDGKLDSTALPNASFYFINPAGIVFGASAQVNVPSAAYFSTAAELRTADGAKFAVATPGGSTLSMAAPESFGFVGGAGQGAISLDGPQLTFFPSTATLSLSAGDVSVANSQFAARGLDLVAVGSRATSVRLADPLSAAADGMVSLQGSRLVAFTMDAPGAPVRVAGGEIRLAATALGAFSFGAGRGGDLVLQGDRVTLAPDAFVNTFAGGAGAGGDIRVKAGVLEVDARGATTTTGFGSIASGDGASGGIALTADTLNLTGEVGNTTGSGFAVIGSNIFGAGDAGDIVLTAKDLTVDIALINSSSVGAGDGGDIRISAPNLQLGGATVLTQALGDGRPGDVRIDGDKIAISGGQFGASPGSRQASGGLVIAATTSLESEGGAFTAVSANPTSSGTVTLRAPYLLLSQSRLDTQAFGDGLAGQILVEADTLLLDRVQLTSDSADGPMNTGLVRLKSTGDLVIFQGIYSAQVNGTAAGGRIEIEGRDVLLSGAEFHTETGGFGTGDAGQIAVTSANSLDLNNVFITSDSSTEGRGGNVTLRARTMQIENATEIRSESRFSGDAGRIEIFASDSLDIIENSDVSSRAFSGTGNGGSVKVEAGRLSMADATVASDSFSAGRAGTVEVKANQIDLDGGNRGFTGISSDARSQGDAGSVTIDAKTLTIRNGAYVSSFGFLGGNAGDITVRSGEISISRGSSINSTGTQTNGGKVSVVADKLTMTSEPGRFSFISSTASGGNAGNLSLDVGTLLLDASNVSSDTFGAGNAGDLRIKAGDITLKNMSGISSSTGSFGNAGALTIEAKTITLEAGSQILSVASSKSDGDARSITIKADAITVGQDAAITTATFGRGNAGKVDITAKSLRVSDGGEVSSSASLPSEGRAGDVSLSVGDLTVLNGGLVSTLSANPNKAGELRITASGQVTVDGERSSISSANIADDRGDAGEIFLTAKGLRIANGAAINTSSTAGAAGNIAIRVARPGLVVLEGKELPGVIVTSSGPGTGGVITLSDPLAIISNGGKILALGQQRGANVLIQSRFFINSSDRRNVVDVAGDFQLEAGLTDVSSGTVNRDLSVLDASKVLQGQCPVARSTGVVSQLITRPVGPYVRDPGFSAPPPPLRTGPANIGACP